ncbi:carbohydrate-binding family 9-like protein [Nannocystaceae bacterium ST9]
MRSSGLVALALWPAFVLGCGRSEASVPDRQAPPVMVAQSIDEDARHFDGEVRYANGGKITARSISPATLRPARAGAGGSGGELVLTSEGLGSLDAEIGLLPPLAAARQEVAHDTPGQPEDPRSRWIAVGLGEGEQRFELPTLGDDWHAAHAVVVLEVRAGRNWLPALEGPRSEMVRGEQRFPGGRVILGVIPVERRPTQVAAARVEPGAITIDGVLDESVWIEREPSRLLVSRTGEPPDEIDAQLGGPSEVWFAWDDEFLYVAGALPDPDLFAEQREQDDPIYRNEAFEVFVAADDAGERYLEFQVSARNVSFDARFPRYRKGDEAWDGTWTSAVSLDGELERRGGDRGWSVELAFPWAELCRETALRCPAQGQTMQAERSLRVNVFRLDKPEREGQVGLALSPTIQPDFHAWANAAELWLEP